MPTELKPIIYGTKMDVDLAKFTIDDVQTAIVEDLVGRGNQVQGVRIANTWVGLKDKHKAVESPYVQVGVDKKGHLLLVVRSKKKASFESAEVLVKDYVKLKQKLAARTTSVTNLEPDDDVIKGSAAALRNRHGLTANDDPDYGTITGDIILDAHGANEVAQSGRVIGTRMGRKTPAEIVALLTTDKDPKKRIGKGFDGTLKLIACFTAAGGPEAQKKDEPFAQKVLQLFRDKGYKKISVVGYPGMVGIARGAGADSHGTPLTEGDSVTWTNRATGATDQRAELLEAAATKAGNALGAQKTVTTNAKNAMDRAFAHTNDGIADSPLAKAKYLAAGEGKARLDAYNAAKAEHRKQQKAQEKIQVAYDKATKALKDSGLNDILAHIEGRFGLQTLN